MRSHGRFAVLRACEALADLHPLYDALAEAEARHGTLAELEFAPRIHSGAPRVG